MRIGFTSIYSWRPHVEHLHFLARLVQEAGHETRFLTCDSNLSACYGREMRPHRPAWQHCLSCRIGGVRSYEGSGVASIGHLTQGDRYRLARPTKWAHSSAATLGRFETDADFAGPEFLDMAARLEPAARLAYEAARRWIDEQGLDAICVFNGRMDATRGVTEAARDAGIRFVSMERTWFGDGLLLLPDENCLGLRSVDAMMSEWRNIPLNRAQALRAAGHVAGRFLKSNAKEWRAYNTNAIATPWPVTDGHRKVLLTPSSRNEFFGHPDWGLRWPSLTDGFDALMDHLGLEPTDVVLRCHPNWGERIGTVDGSRSEVHFSEWARRRGIFVVSSVDRSSTLGLIEQADAVVVCGGSAALEAGILGKQVIALGPSIYQKAGFQSDAYDSEQLAGLRLQVDLDAATQARERERVARLTLRFCHTMVYRVSQYVPHVRSITTTRYEYIDGADPDQLLRLMRSGRLEADDATVGALQVDEDQVLALVRERAWQSLQDAAPQPLEAICRPVNRRWLFRPVDQLRELLPRGDV
jgi:hypothetical protein